MKKFIVSTFIISVFVTYSFIHDHGSLAAIMPRSSSLSSDNSNSTNSSSSNTSDSSGTSATSTSTPASGIKDGTFTGTVQDAQWGYVQVKVVIKNGKITDVPFIQYPNDRSRSRFINSIADPQLTSEAVQVQSANVDIVTGATDSSEAFMQSLSDALTQAGWQQ